MYYEFSIGHFTVQKTKRVFSTIPIDQAHEQNNSLVKGDGGAVGLTENPSAMRRWMIAGPEIARVISEFEASESSGIKKVDTSHHDQTASVQRAFARDVRSLCRGVGGATRHTVVCSFVCVCVCVCVSAMRISATACY